MVTKMLALQYIKGEKTTESNSRTTNLQRASKSKNSTRTTAHRLKTFSRINYGVGEEAGGSVCVGGGGLMHFYNQSTSSLVTMLLLELKYIKKGSYKGSQLNVYASSDIIKIKLINVIKKGEYS